MMFAAWDILYERESDNDIKRCQHNWTSSWGRSQSSIQTVEEEALGGTLAILQTKASVFEVAFIRSQVMIYIAVRT